MSALTGLADLEALVLELAENDEEQRLMAQAVRLLAFAPVTIEPTADLKDRVVARLRVPDERPHFFAENSFFARGAEMEWMPYAPGVEVKVLHQDPGSSARTTLVRMGPNLPFPPHPHGFIEDLYLINGEAWVGDTPMRAGDYCRADVGTEHNTVRSGPSGSLAVVVSR